FFIIIFFFFQAEDGIRDRNVTGVQTCALPISSLSGFPIDLFITFVGLTYLFGFTQNNGAIDVLGRSCMADRRRPKLSRVYVCCSCSSFRIRKLTSFTPCLNGSCRCSTKDPWLSKKGRAVMLTSAVRLVA